MNDKEEKRAEDVESESFVLIRFTGVGEAQFSFSVQNASPAQILGAISILEVYAKNAYLQEETRRREYEAASKLSVPSPHIEVGRK